MNEIPEKIIWLRGALIRAIRDLRRDGHNEDALVITRWFLELLDRYPTLRIKGWDNQAVLRAISRGQFPENLP